jgi:hypothetical protein
VLRPLSRTTASERRIMSKNIVWTPGVVVQTKNISQKSAQNDVVGRMALSLISALRRSGKQALARGWGAIKNGFYRVPQGIPVSHCRGTALHAWDCGVAMAGTPGGMMQGWGQGTWHPVPGVCIPNHTFSTPCSGIHPIQRCP